MNANFKVHIILTMLLPTYTTSASVYKESQYSDLHTNSHQCSW